jgi:hypothetical protein
LPSKTGINIQVLTLGLLVLLILAGLTWMNFQFSLQNPGGNDFLARWNGAHFWVVEHVSPYAEQVGLSTQQIVYHHPANPALGEDKNLFVYPFYSLIFFGPFGALDYPAARAGWMTLLECSLVAVLALSLKLSGWKASLSEVFGLILFSLFWYPGVRTLILGQFSGVNAVLILASLVLIRSEKDIAAGLLLALSTSKPQMVFLIIPFCLIWGASTRRWKLVISLLGGIALLIAGSMVYLPRWPIEWFGQMLDYPTYTGRIGTVIAIIAGSIPSASAVLSIGLYALLGFWLAWEWYRAWGKGDRHFLWTALLTLVISNFIAFRTATPHYVLFLPILLMVFKEFGERWGRPGRAITWTVLVLLFAALWLLFIVTLDGNTESALNYVPLPFISLLALGWLRWSENHPRGKAISDLGGKEETAAG